MATIQSLKAKKPKLPVLPPASCPDEAAFFDGILANPVTERMFTTGCYNPDMFYPIYILCDH